jgi:hypothetical protein
MTDTTTTATGSATAARPGWLIHPVQAWRAYQAALAERADAEAVAAGLTVQVLPNGVRRYRDPRLDQLPAHCAAQGAASPYPGVRNGGDAVDATAWSTPTLVLARVHALDVGVLSAGPAAPAAGTTDHRTERGGLHRLAGAGAVPPPTVPPQGHSGFASVSHATALRAALDPGHPAAAVSGAPAGSREEHAPARLPSGPANTRRGAR